MIGVGFFGLPFIGIQSGFGILLLAFGVGGMLIYLINRSYAEVILGTDGKHRLPGYVERYLGSDWKHLAFATTTLGLWGALVSYLLIGSNFLGNIFQPLIGGSNLFYLALFFVGGVYLVSRGARSVARTETIFVSVFAGLILLLTVFGIPKFSSDAVSLAHPARALLPYGLVLFALWGANVLPDAAELAGKNRRKLFSSIAWALVIAATLYGVFALVVGSLSGFQTTRDGLSGLHSFLPENVLTLVYLLGFFPTFMAFLALGMNLKKIFTLDYGFHEIPAYLLTFGIPLGLVLVGVNNVLGVISIIGGVILGVEGYLILRMYEHFAKERKMLRHPNAFPFLRYTRPVRFILLLGVVIGLLTPYLLSRV